MSATKQLRLLSFSLRAFRAGTTGSAWTSTVALAYLSLQITTPEVEQLFEAVLAIQRFLGVGWSDIRHNRGTICCCKLGFSAHTPVHPTYRVYDGFEISMDDDIPLTSWAGPVAPSPVRMLAKHMPVEATKS